MISWVKVITSLYLTSTAILQGDVVSRRIFFTQFITLSYILLTVSDVRHSDIITFDMSQVAVRWQILFINTCRRSQYVRSVTVVSRVNLKFVVGSVSFHTCCRKGSGIQVNLQAPCVLYIGQAFRYSPENAFIYLINKYISLSDIWLTVHHWYK